MVPAKEMVEIYQLFGSSTEDVFLLHSSDEDQRQILALYLLNVTFGPEDASILYAGYVRKYISAAFERLMRLYRGEDFHG
jgi:hypothetical protein